MCLRLAVLLFALTNAHALTPARNMRQTQSPEELMKNVHVMIGVAAPGSGSVDWHGLKLKKHIPEYNTAARAKYGSPAKAFQHADANANGFLTRAEWNAEWKLLKLTPFNGFTAFQEMDKNEDELVSAQELYDQVGDLKGSARFAHDPKGKRVTIEFDIEKRRDLYALAPLIVNKLDEAGIKGEDVKRSRLTVTDTEGAVVPDKFLDVEKDRFPLHFKITCVTDDDTGTYAVVNEPLSKTARDEYFDDYLHDKNPSKRELAYWEDVYEKRNGGNRSDVALGSLVAALLAFFFLV